jgi:hypothetical protein
MDKNPLLNEIQKKDTDAEIIETTDDGYIIKTTLNIGVEIEEPETIQFPRISIHVRIVRHMFVCHALVSFAFSIYGIVPLYLLLTDYIISLSLFISSLVMSLILYILMYALSDKKWALPSYIIWIFNEFVVICSLAGMLQSLAPFQACVIFFIESISMILLGFCFAKEVNVYYSIFTMVTSGIIVWTIGLVAFIREQDWITSMVLFGICVILGPVYSGYQINRINENRYHSKEIERVLIQYWADPLIILIEACCKRKELKEEDFVKL